MWRNWRHAPKGYLGNLGEVHIRIKEWDAAAQYLAMSIDICKSTLPTAAGAFSGSLAWICAKQGNLTEALKHIEYGEPLVAVYPLEHAKFLCRKAQILHWSNRSYTALEALGQAQQIKESLHTENKELSCSTIVCAFYQLSDNDRTKTSDTQDQSLVLKLRLNRHQNCVPKSICDPF